MAALQTAGETRLQTAIRIASADIDQSKSSDRFSVFSAGATLSPVKSRSAQAGFTSARSARSALETLTAGYEVDRLSAVVTPLIGSREYDQVWIYTDKSLEQDVISPSVRVVTVPSDREAHSNVWIESVAVKQTTAQSSGSAPETSTLSVTLAAVGRERADVTLSGECFASPGTDPVPLSSIPAKVTTDNTVTTTLGPLPGRWGYCRVRLEPESPDALPLDNEAWVAHSTTQSSVRLVSALTAQELGLSALPYTITSPTEAELLTTGGNSIYHRTPPPSKAISGASLVVFPPATKALFGSGAASQPRSERGKNIEVTRWTSSHPILQYVQPTLMTFPTVSILTCPDTAQPFVFVAEGPVACAGEQNGFRYVITGFELFPFDGLRSPTVSIFTLNALRWLFEGAGGVSHSNALIGTVTLPYEASSVRTLAPLPETLTTAPTKSVVVRAPGILSVRRGDAGAKEDGESLVAVNAFSNEESDLSRQYSISVSDAMPQQSASPRSAVSERDGTPLEWFLAVGLLVVLGLDLIRRIAVRAQWGGTV
jgi:hypothetical protein